MSDELVLIPIDKEWEKLSEEIRERLKLSWDEWVWLVDKILPKVKQHYKQNKEQGRREGIQAVIDYLKNEIATQDKRTAGEPKLKAHLNAVEKVVLQTVINALEEWLNG